MQEEAHFYYFEVNKMLTKVGFLSMCVFSAYDILGIGYRDSWSFY